MHYNIQAKATLGPITTNILLSNLLVYEFYVASSINFKFMQHNTRGDVMHAARICTTKHNIVKNAPFINRHKHAQF